jgi:hypothetical protein
MFACALAPHKKATVTPPKLKSKRNIVYKNKHGEYPPFKSMCFLPSPQVPRRPPPGPHHHD